MLLSVQVANYIDSNGWIVFVVFDTYSRSFRLMHSGCLRNIGMRGAGRLDWGEDSESRCSDGKHQVTKGCAWKDVPQLHPAEAMNVNDLSNLYASSCSHLQQTRWLMFVCGGHEQWVMWESSTIASPCEPYSVNANPWCTKVRRSKWTGRRSRQAGTGWQDGRMAGDDATPLPWPQVAYAQLQMVSGLKRVVFTDFMLAIFQK